MLAGERRRSYSTSARLASVRAHFESDGMFDLHAIQSALREFGFDGWFLYDFRGSNLLARRILDLGEKPVTSRRFAYCIPASGEPRKLVHRIEPGALDHLPGTKT